MLRRWMDLYTRGEKAARAFFAEHFADVCAHCYRISEEGHTPDFNCCRRVNFLQEILVDPLLGALAEESLGHSLLPLTSPRSDRGCMALGSEGCLIPFGRPDLCNSYVCEHLYECALVLPAGTMYRIQDELELFAALRNVRRQSLQEYADCLERLERLEALLQSAAEHLRAHAEEFAARKGEVIRQMAPPHYCEY